MYIYKKKNLNHKKYIMYLFLFTLDVILITDICMYVCMYACMYVRMNVCMSYVCIYIRMYLCI